MTRTTPELASPSPESCTTLKRGRLAPTYGLICNRPKYMADLQRNRVLNHEADTLSLGHRGPSKVRRNISMGSVSLLLHIVGLNLKSDKVKRKEI
ncbi:hypothetical protein AVEN_127796-1 [Araneus ventricosus]|uniref:Uncharacterized protein n=1 Tax=Araneus ventricosus TaxID=182803 RepID=A0A4Y2DNH9_ARAVE|nr:hypothetical protein AVEN_127796-1 [Araneus ventricosus]